MQDPLKPFAAERSQMNDLLLIALGHSAFQYLYAGCSLGLFELLESRPGLQLAEIASALALAEYSTRCLLLGLKALKLVMSVDLGHHNSPAIRRLFARGEWRHFVDLMSFEARIVYPGESDFVASLRSGTNVGLRRIPGEGRDLYHRLSGDAELQAVFYQYMKSWSALSNPLLLNSFDFSGVGRVLDVGGGEGTNAIAIAKAYRHVEITLLELSENADLARRRIADEGLGGRISVMELDILTAPFPAGFDCALFIHLLVIWPPDVIVDLLKKAHDALTDAGSVVIFSSMSSDTGDGPLMAALDTAYFVSIPSGKGMIYAPRDYEEYLKRAGFVECRRIEVSSWTPHGIVAARKGGVTI